VMATLPHGRSAGKKGHQNPTNLRRCSAAAVPVLLSGLPALASMPLTVGG